MKNFYHYLTEAKKQEYNYRIKTLFEISDTLMDRLERTLEKYKLVEVTRPIKADVKDCPFEFRDIDNASVWMVDVTTQKPASSYILQQELRSAFEVNEKMIVVRGSNEPLETETKRINATKDMDKIAKDQGLTPQPLLSTNQNYEDYEQRERPVSYGDSYNMRFLDYLAEIEAERPDGIAETGLSQKKWSRWLTDPKKTEDFNKDYDTVKPVTKKKPSATPVPNVEVSNEDNFDDRGSRITKVYRDEKKDIVVLSRTIGDR